MRRHISIGLVIIQTAFIIFVVLVSSFVCFDQVGRKVDDFPFHPASLSGFRFNEFVLGEKSKVSREHFQKVEKSIKMIFPHFVLGQ